jgi:hypothetical protein
VPQRKHCAVHTVRKTIQEFSIPLTTAAEAYAAAAFANTEPALFHLRTAHPGHAPDHQTHGTREEFNREKLLEGIRLSCTKRPVSAADINHLSVNRANLQKMGREEVSSRVVGDMVINGLKELDHIAYIRYAIVYLQLSDLQSIRKEIDHLLEG